LEEKTIIECYPMLEDKQIEEAKNNAVKAIESGNIIKTKESRYVDFFLKNAKDSLDSAKVLFEASTNESLKGTIGIPGFNGYLWVINASYYSMFYMARALLESVGVKVKKEESIHFVVFNALIYYFYSTGKLQRHFIEDLKNAQEDSSELLGKEKAKKILDEYSIEKEKRVRFTYELGETAMRGKAETSLTRAKKFNEEIRKIVGR